MAVSEQLIADQFAVYCGDCVSVMRGLPGKTVDLCVYSPPFAGLYQYSSDPRDMSNSIDKDEFFEHYGYCIDETARLLKPGRISAVHCMDIPLSNAGCDAMYDLPGEIIRRHLDRGFDYGGRRVIWKEPLMVRNRTMMKSLHHKTLCEDSTRTSIANADYLIMFRRKGENTIPVVHQVGFLDYVGERVPPAHLRRFRGMKGDQKRNEWSQWIWRQYASSVWDDIRIDRVLPYRSAREGEDEKHVHPLQLDVIDRCVALWSNPGETVFTPFLGVGSEAYSAVRMGRKAIGVELKPTYFRQAIKNLQSVDEITEDRPTLFDLDQDQDELTAESTPTENTTP